MKRVKHIAFFKFKPDCTPGDIAGVWRIIEDLPRQIPGILGLTYAAKTTTSLPTFVGVQFDTRYTFANGMLLTPYGRVSWVHEFQLNRGKYQLG